MEALERAKKGYNKDKKADIWCWYLLIITHEKQNKLLYHISFIFDVSKQLLYLSLKGKSEKYCHNI